MEPFERQFKRIHAEHTVRAIPETLVARAQAIANGQWGSGREVLELFAVLGALTLGPEGAFALASALLLVVSYLFFAHSAGWTAYYTEIQTVLAFLTALGLCGVLASLWRVSTRLPDRRLPSVAVAKRRFAFVLFAALLLVPMLVQAARESEARRQTSQNLVRFHERVERLPNRSIVFVRYWQGHNVHESLVENEPDLDTARVWTVFDLGEHNEALARLAPDRRTYLYDERAQGYDGPKDPLTPLDLRGHR
jgi:hypothetical protein